MRKISFRLAKKIKNKKIKEERENSIERSRTSEARKENDENWRKSDQGMFILGNQGNKAKH